ncbi:MazG family protein [Agromyces humatus]|uniref:NTP pyrophosphohydrolase MazG-like domain-containing protein n=1 Tax=Agromyces humatus TaxID=279573 RepID=A0ABP4WYQ7_9MICO|nr:MazG family protein [Agromyces humatus]
MTEVDRVSRAETDRATALDELIKTVALLRAPGGCPWDADQTHESLVQYLVEECWELIDAIETGDRAEMIEELGDVLYQVLFHADIAAHTPGEDFDIDDVARHMTAKMVSRHPHVFGDREAHTAADVVAFWDDLKKDEKPHRTSVLDGVPRGMPALSLARKVLDKSEKVEVTVADVPAPSDAAAATSPATEPELGRMLLELVESARAQGLDAERALRGAVRDLEDQVRRAEQASSVEA